MRHTPARRYAALAARLGGSFELRLAGLMLLALALRLLIWRQPLHQPANDEFEYITVARDIIAGRGLSFYERYRWLRAPLYPLFLAGSLRLSGGDLHLAALPNLLLSAGVVGLIARIARALDPRRGDGPALLAGLLAALLMTAATFAGLYMAETLFAFLLALALLQLLRWRAAGRRAAWLHAGAAGLCLGLACLTRSAPLLFLPAALLWMAWLASSARGAGRPLRPALAQCLLVPLACGLVIAPWTLRNCAAYGSCILIETGLSYNLWAFSEPRESIDAINRALEAVANPAERADLASERGVARLREDPAIILRKLPSSWIALWAVKPIQDRFLLASYYSDPPPLVFLGGLLLDDALYLLILLVAPLGAARALARRDAGAILLLLWVGYVVATTLLTHAEGRYRHFLWPALIPFAALALAARPGDREIGSRGDRWRLMIGGGAATFLALALAAWLAYYPWGWAARGATRAVFRAAGAAAQTLGNAEWAAGAYGRGLELAPSPDLWLALGELRYAVGDSGGAEAAYREAARLAPPYPAASARLGDLLRESGRPEAARAAFVGRYQFEQQMVDWSFSLLRPRPQAALDLGDGLDFGYVGGVYPAEQLAGASARWTGGQAKLRLTPETGSPAGALLLSLRVAGPRPDGAAPELTICRGAACQQVPLAVGWRVAHIALPAGPGPILLRSPTFIAPDGRALGVMLDWARVEAQP